jgi:hypothetical protein
VTGNEKAMSLPEAWEWRFGKRTTVMHRASDYNLWRGCVNKIRFETWKDAKASNPHFYIYGCDYCGGYHHTRQWPGRGPK